MRLEPALLRENILKKSRSAPCRLPSKWMRPAAALCALLLAAAGLYAQAGPADAQHSGAIRGSLITQENTATGLAGIVVKLSVPASDGNAETAETDDGGHYEFLKLKPGRYTVSVGQAGFKSVSKEVAVGEDQAVALDLKLEIETVAEKVEVNENTQAIATEDASTRA